MISFPRAMLCTARYCHGIASVCLSVCDALQVPVLCSHRLEFFENNFTAEQLKAYALADPNMGDLVQREHPQNYGRIEVGPWGQEHIKAVISPKWCKIGLRLFLGTISHTRFRLAPKSMTSDDLERPKRHSCRNKQDFRSLNSFRIKIRAKYSDRKREQN